MATPESITLVIAVFLLASLAAVVPALIGMFVGQRMCDRIEPVALRNWFFIAMLAVGSCMAARGLVTR